MKTKLLCLFLILCAFNISAQYPKSKVCPSTAILYDNEFLSSWETSIQITTFNNETTFKYDSRFIGNLGDSNAYDYPSITDNVSGFASYHTRRSIAIRNQEVVKIFQFVDQFFNKQIAADSKVFSIIPDFIVSKFLFNLNSTQISQTNSDILGDQIRNIEQFKNPNELLFVNSDS